jgi:hypothetical protein
MKAQGAWNLSRLWPGMRYSLLLAALGCAGCGLVGTAAFAQSDESVGDAGRCTLKSHVYTCNGAEFQAALQSAKTVAIEAHNADGVARNELTSFVTRKLGKTVAADGGPADLIFLMIPIEPSGVISNNDTDLGTLRIYSSAPDGARGHLLWAETLFGAQDLPWPMVVHGLIAQFQSHFHIK